MWGNLLVDFANFTKIEWTNCEAAAADASGKVILLTPGNGTLTIVNLAQGPRYLTTTNITRDQVTTFYLNDVKKAVQRL